MKTKVAVVQATPALFDKNRTLNIVADWTKKVAQEGAQLVLFPEAFIPCYPRGLSFGAVVGSRKAEGREHWLKYNSESVVVPSTDTERLAQIAKEHQVYLIIGIIEKDQTSSLYCTMLYFSPDGKLMGKHRKLKPTGSERIIWGEGDGSDLHVFDTPFGKLGGLICWENYMPLARFALYQQNIQIYLAPTADHRESWTASMQHIACEGRCFVLGCNQYVEKSDYPEAFQAEITDQPDIMSKGGSVIVDPLGNIIAGPLWDQEGILFADIDVEDTVRGKLDFDATGHYNRPDVFEFRVKT
ncbi:carbon-nitrogen hydrolase family protein [Kordia sp.]|uniref:carbon-nitrogen hydrolase family protein n=1 Tax=Kordia sp. TaxID=1965332 RepID=UPI0025C66A97|nr:carbon-nitrogen hydrolase family protein [Kordia sp.]MCH2080914.1 carbon-nitrogen hydrolase family protein [Saprospiraceae bacterium]MCH2193292.1 carbon-nitrogen hydrolase family protein [Kordia sp.]